MCDRVADLLTWGVLPHGQDPAGRPIDDGVDARARLQGRDAGALVAHRHAGVTRELQPDLPAVIGATDQSPGLLVDLLHGQRVVGLTVLFDLERLRGPWVIGQANDSPLKELRKRDRTAVNADALDIRHGQGQSRTVSQLDGDRLALDIYATQPSLRVRRFEHLDAYRFPGVAVEAHQDVASVLDVGDRTAPLTDIHLCGAGHGHLQVDVSTGAQRQDAFLHVAPSIGNDGVDRSASKDPVDLFI